MPALVVDGAAFAFEWGRLVLVAGGTLLVLCVTVAWARHATKVEDGGSDD